MTAALSVARALTGNAAVRGDANANGALDIDDVNLLVNAMLCRASRDFW
ncbi:MAG: hypothetical protein IKR25_12720 [Muribaculaceae bacterium]|nr:hypothetical protein [Muribaculaceae bacterium]